MSGGNRGIQHAAGNQRVCRWPVPRRTRHATARTVYDIEKEVMQPLVSVRSEGPAAQLPCL